MNVAQYMQRGAVTALPNTPLSGVRDVMEEHGFGLLLIASSDAQLVGFVTRASLKGVSDWDQPVEKRAYPVKFAVEPGDTLEKAALILLENRLVLLPVTEDGKLVGVLSQSEILRGLSEGLGVGLEGTRLSVSVREGSRDVYRVLEVLEKHTVDLVSLTHGKVNGDRREAIFRVQGIADREALLASLEARLREP